MKVIHVLDEISKKNISLFRVAQIISKYSFLDKKFPLATANNKGKESNVVVFKNSIKNFLYFSKIFFFLKKNSPDVVHVHGLWRPLHFLFFMKCNFLNIPVVIQPHGMILDAALKNKSRFSYLLKIIILNIYKIILQKNISFVAVTPEEKLSILKYFPKAMINVITSPFVLSDSISQNIKKNFVYFGRFNRHKNLKEFIQAFIEAKLGKDWSFDIYGIDDDANYKKEIIKFISKSNNQNSIKFLKPEFDIKKKYKIISESWCNVLLSKSEVLSLSVLEACSLGTQSIVNKKIFFPKWIKKNLTRSSMEKSKLIANIKKISQQNIKELKKKKKIVKKLFKDSYSLTEQEYKYKNFLKKIVYKASNQNLSFNGWSVFANLLNSMIVPFLMVLSVLFSRESLATEIGIVPGVCLLLTQLFSGNARSLLIYNENKNDFKQILSFRVLIGLPIFLLSLSLSIILGFREYLPFLFILTLIVYISWIVELFIATHEKNKSSLLNKCFTITIFIFYLYLILYFKHLNNLEYIFLSYVFFQILYISFHFNSRNLEFLKIHKTFFKFNKSIPLVSSFFSISAVIIWRISLLYLLDKGLAGMFYACFAIASFPGSVFNNFIGQTIMLNVRIKYFINKNILIIYYAGLFIICTLLFITEMYLVEHELHLFIRYCLISLFGTGIMLFALYRRHSILSKGEKYQKIIFQKDIFYGLAIAPIVIIFYYLGGDTLVGFSYIMSSIIAFLFYRKIFI